MRGCSVINCIVVDEHIDTTKVYNELREKISLVKAPEVKL